MEHLFIELNDHIMGYLDMWSSYQLACTNVGWMAIFTAKLEHKARAGFTGFAQIIYGAKLPTGFAKILLMHYFRNIKSIDSRPDYSTYMSFATIEHVIGNFMTINGLKNTALDKTISGQGDGVNSHVMLNVKLSDEYKETHAMDISRYIFCLLNAGQVSMVAAIVYLQRFTPEYITRIIYGLFREKVLFWLHPDVAPAPINATIDDANIHICRECMYGNFNHYDARLADKLAASRDTDCLDHHIAYAYKYINYW
ncbi:hypothetical protein PRJ_Dakar_00433 [Faustovirus]|nr:hypothetical protein PRJ_Dakar_00433 [Faustovirus]